MAFSKDRRTWTEATIFRFDRGRGWMHDPDDEAVYERIFVREDNTPILEASDEYAAIEIVIDYQNPDADTLNSDAARYFYIQRDERDASGARIGFAQWMGRELDIISQHDLLCFHAEEVIEMFAEEIALVRNMPNGLVIYEEETPVHEPERQEYIERVIRAAQEENTRAA